MDVDLDIPILKRTNEEHANCSNRFSIAEIVPVEWTRI